ncbi:MAG TPA: hypothetical protein VIM69_12885, partial [Opitutaceae bacterium]
MRPPLLLLCFRVLAIAAVLLALGISVGRAANGLVEQPLSPRSGPRGATLFQTLPPEQTGVVTENPYDDPRMWGDLYQEYVY